MEIKKKLWEFYEGYANIAFFKFKLLTITTQILHVYICDSKNLQKQNPN